MATWRTGRKLGRTIYKDEVCVGLVDTPAIAFEIVSTMNAKERLDADLKSLIEEPGYEVSSVPFDK